MNLNRNDIRKLKNKRWRVENLYWITNKQKHKVKFKLNKAQQHLFKDESRFNAILKARQLGISTYYMLYYLDTCLFNRNRTVCILAHEQDAIKKLFRIARYAYDNMNPAVKPVINKGGGSAYEMYFPEINSRIYCDLESRGDTISDLHISEFAFCRDRSKVLATMDAVPISTGNISIETTANGLNHFYEDWTKENWTFKRHFFPWFYMKEYYLDGVNVDGLSEEETSLKNMAMERYGINLSDEEIAFRRYKISQKNKQHFMQEFAEDELSCFLMSGNPVMDRFEVQDMISKLSKVIRTRLGVDILKEPEDGVQYVIGADTAEGVGSDYSVASIYSRDTMEQVAIFRSNDIKPFDFAEKLLQMGDLYAIGKEKPLIAVERNNHGHAVLGKLKEMGYPKLYFANDKKLGWHTNKVTRPVMIDTFINGVETGEVKINDLETLRECLTLVDNKGKIEAEKGCHDDCVIASSIAVQVCLKKQSVRNIRLTGL